MLVVCDATPLHYLVLIGEIDLLRKLYGRVVVPQAVIEELSVAKTPAQIRSWITELPEWATVGQVHPLVPLPFEFLGLGERQAIALVRDAVKGVLITDDSKARDIAESVQIQVVPTIRLLSTASDLLLVDFDDAVNRLRQTNFRVSRDVIDQIVALRSRR